MTIVIAIGASAGGPSTLVRLLRQLPADFPAALMVATHLPARGPSHLVEMLDKEAAMTVIPAIHGEVVQQGIVYVAVPDQHLMLADGRVRLARGPKENHSRPSVDVLFRSCALSLGSQAIGVVLTGSLDDGTAGLWSIKDRQGQAIVQAPDEADYPSMPRSAIAHVAVDYVARIDDMPAIFLKAVHEARSRSESKPVSEKLKIETQIAEGHDALSSGSLSLGPSSELTCPECGGVLAQIEEGSIVRFRCHTGHAYSGESLANGTDEKIDDLLWRLLRALDERTLILLRSAASAKPAASSQEIEGLQQQIRANRKRGDLIRELLMPDRAATG